MPLWYCGMQNWTEGWNPFEREGRLRVRQERVISPPPPLLQEFLCGRSSSRTIFRATLGGLRKKMPVLVEAGMINDGVNPEYGLRFFVRWNPFKRLLTYTVCFLDCGRTTCIYYSFFKVMASKTRKTCSVIPFHWELMWGFTAWTKTRGMLIAGYRKIGSIIVILGIGNQ